jgi:hypothetical protein
MLNKELPVLIGAANVTQFFYSPNIFSNIFSNIFHFFSDLICFTAFQRT